ncbi:MAG: hypothetical protein FVQ82_06790 [Planctomycetes bacterium]|nr:hypothetical protein [Planctomycetota bacterium]
MYALNKKSWPNLRSEFQTRPPVQRLAHFLDSSRLWAAVGSIFVLTLIIAAVTAIAMLALWISNIDLSTFDPTPMLK